MNREHVLGHKSGVRRIIRPANRGTNCHSARSSLTAQWQKKKSHICVTVLKRCDFSEAFFKSCPPKRIFDHLLTNAANIPASRYVDDYVTNRHLSARPPKAAGVNTGTFTHYRFLAVYLLNDFMMVSPPILISRHFFTDNNIIVALGFALH